MKSNIPHSSAPTANQAADHCMEVTGSVDAKLCLPTALAIANVQPMDLANPTETAVRIVGSAFTDTLLNVSLRGLDDTQVLGKKLIAELLKRGLHIVPGKPSGETP